MKNKFILISLSINIFSSCGIIDVSHNYYSSVQPDSSMKDKVQSFVSYIATDEEKNVIKKLNSDAELNSFLINFWQKRDSSPETKVNEYKNEYVRRFTYANLYLGGYHTDKGRIYILYGAPDDIITDNMNNPKHIIFTNLEIWIYNRPITHVEMPNAFIKIQPNLVKFVFADLMGFGTKEQIYSTEEGEKVDSRVFN